MLIQQNFSLAAGDDIDILLDVGPDATPPVTLPVGTQLTFRMYAQQAGVPIGDPVVTKDLDSGLEISDPDYGLVVVTFASADTIALAPTNYAYEITTYDTDGKRITVTEGMATLARTKNPQGL